MSAQQTSQLSILYLLPVVYIISLILGFSTVSSGSHGGPYQSAQQLFAIDRFKTAPPNIALSTIEHWETKDKNLHAFLATSIPEALEHTGSTSFDEHLKGVSAVLRHWGAEEHLVYAGMFHSIYGTEGFQGFSLSYRRRRDVEKLIGKRAERLAFIFCTADRMTVDDLVSRHHDRLSGGDQAIEQVSYSITARHELGRFEITFPSEYDWLDFIELTLADWLEQVEGASMKKSELFHWGVGEAWSYRRVAYQRMAEILADRRGLSIAKLTHESVYAMESSKTKLLHQRMTPPMSSAARQAREAYAARMIDWSGDFTTCER